jgi:hypothetical protein
MISGYEEGPAFAARAIAVVRRVAARSPPARWVAPRPDHAAAPPRVRAGAAASAPTIILGSLTGQPVLSASPLGVPHILRSGHLKIRFPRSSTTSLRRLASPMIILLSSVRDLPFICLFCCKKSQGDRHFQSSSLQLRRLSASARRSRHRCRPARRCAATSGACGSRRVGSANGPSHGLSSGGSQGWRKTTPERYSAIMAA